MSRRTISITDELHQYILDATLRDTPVLARLREETGQLELANMQIAPEQGQFMAFLCETMGATRALEIGTFTGYSALCVAQVLPKDGKLVCCDTSAEWTEIARRYWEEAGVADRIDLRLGPAIETLDQMLKAGDAETIDFAFIDADKDAYPDYYERVLKLLRPGGVLALDNALSAGRVLAPDKPEHANARVIDRLNRMIGADERVSVSMVPIGDGLLLARKR